MEFESSIMQCLRQLKLSNNLLPHINGKKSLEVLIPSFLIIYQSIYKEKKTTHSIIYIMIKFIKIFN